MTRAAILIIVLMVTACTPDVQPELVHTKSVPQCLNGRVFAEWRIGFGLPEANHLDPIVHQLVVDNYNNVEPISSHNPARVYVFGRPAFGDALIFFVNATGMCVELAFPAPLSIVLKWMTPPKPFGVPVIYRSVVYSVKLESV